MERKILIVLCSLAFLFSIASYFAYTQKADKDRETYYREQDEKIARNEITFSGPYCFPDRHPSLLLSIVGLTGSTFFSFYLFKRPFIPALFAVASFSMFPYWFVETRNAISQTENLNVDGLDAVYYNAGSFDLVVFGLISVVTSWQISVLLRLLIKTLERRKVMQ